MPRVQGRYMRILRNINCEKFPGVAQSPPTACEPADKLGKVKHESLICGGWTNCNAAHSQHRCNHLVNRLFLVRRGFVSRRGREAGKDVRISTRSI
eukprot:3778880-Amphidinium_carterae.1